MSIYHHADCMNPETGLPSFPDKHFEWAIADPNYGIGEHGGKNRSGRALQKNGTRIFVNGNKYEKKQWDSKPCDPAILDELVRVSKNQIARFSGRHKASKALYLNCSKSSLSLSSD